LIIVEYLLITAHALKASYVFNADTDLKK